MTVSYYQPFPITEFKTGQFNYLEPWVRPQDAFDPLTNGFIYRGSLNKRSGYKEFGRLAYRNNGIQIAVGNGGQNYNGILATFPIRAGSFTATDGVESFTDNGAGVLTGSAGGTGTIVYSTGVWTLHFNVGVIAAVVIRASYTFIPTQTTTPAALALPIMGLKQWANESNGSVLLVGCDTRRASVFNTSTQVFDPLYSVSEQIGKGGAGAGPFAYNAGFGGIAPYSFILTSSVGPIVAHDDGIGNLVGAGVAAGTINYTTGAYSITFAAPNAGLFTLTYNLAGDYFTGDNTNFFNSTNWMGFLYLTNNKDKITLFNGTTLSRPPFSIDQADYTGYVNNIGFCLDVDVYKNRLLVQRPSIVNAGALNGLAPQSIRWSAINVPNNLVADVTGNGGELSAPTDDFMQSSEFLRDALVVLFQNSTWTFRFTNSDFNPFRWDKINNSKSTNAPYGTIDYDQRVTSMGSKGLCATDGVNVQRYDVGIIDQFIDISSKFFGQCFGTRFDTINQSWMLYPSEENSTNKSDKILIYNFLENTWAVYNLALSCLGLYLITTDVNWNYFAPGGSNPLNWDQAQFAWNSYLDNDLEPTLLGGGHTGVVYEMNFGATDNDTSTTTGTAIPFSITSNRWNPFIQTGEKVQFGYIDFYYDINPNIIINISFFTDNSDSPNATRTLTLDGPPNSESAMKRIYINCVGEFLRMTLSNYVPNVNEDPLKGNGTFKISGMVLWARPAGRLTP